MKLSSFRNAMFTALSAAFISSCHSQSYIDLEGLGINCPARDRCQGYRNNLTYMDRNCECDFNCTAFEDCCIDALPNSTTQNLRPSARTDVTCLHIGKDEHSGVYVINKCSSSWNGSRKVKEACEQDLEDFSDPLTTAPATDEVRKKTYRNLACAKCNNANLESLKTFGMRLKCYGLDDELTQEQITSDLFYDQERELWGMNRLNRFGNDTEFIGCDIIYDVQGYLNNSVRFCRSNLVSTCATNWTRRPTIARLCSQYMAVTYSNTHAYKNPHCAICNYKTVDDISCERIILGRKPGEGRFSFHHLIDVNQSDGGEEVGMQRVTMATPECPSGQKYDPFSKKCRRLVCALPGYNVVDGRSKLQPFAVRKWTAVRLLPTVAVDDISCERIILGRKPGEGRFSFHHLIDVNQSDGGEEVGMQRVTMATPECPSGEKYDPFSKKCRRLVCALPGYNVVEGRCPKT